MPDINKYVAPPALKDESTKPMESKAKYLSSVLNLSLKSATVPGHSFSGPRSSEHSQASQSLVFLDRTTPNWVKPKNLRFFGFLILTTAKPAPMLKSWPGNDHIPCKS